MPIIYTCSHCGAQFPKWQGQCPECGKWGTLKEENEEAGKSIKISPQDIIDFQNLKIKKQPRKKTFSSEMDKVLGGGIMPGSLILLSGEPGIGKSTLALQIAQSFPQSLYLSGEESAEQVKLRADRLRLKPYFKFSPLIELEKIIALLKKIKPPLAILDSIQTVYSSEVTGEPGSLAQIRYATVQLLNFTKKYNLPLIIIGHITKEGQVAGPKTLEHLVDTVLYLEGEEKSNLRILRANKNRFGPTEERGIFQMRSQGLQEVKNPGGIFLEEKAGLACGSTLCPLADGRQIFLVEVQALVNKTAFGYPQRRAAGFSLNRLQILAAVLTKRAKINLNNFDLHLNIVGGFQQKDPALDLAVCLAIASAYYNKPLKEKMAVLGEVGLNGEIRRVNYLEPRLKQTMGLGIKKIILPNQQEKNFSSLDLKATHHLLEAIRLAF